MILVLASAVGMGAYTVAVRYYMSSYSARQSFSVISLYSSILLVGLMFCFGDYGRLTQISIGCWLLLTLSALIGIAFGHVLLYQAIQYFGPVVASGVQLITPFITYVVAAVWLGERMSSSEWIGGVLLVASGALLVVARCQCERGSVGAGSRRADESACLMDTNVVSDPCSVTRFLPAPVASRQSQPPCGQVASMPRAN
jgi:drug/metabolite transporter (DMT)-like permease